MAILRIELLEDCDMNSGRTVNTYFVDDVFFDAYGLPYIPAWVIRNSLAAAIDNCGTYAEDKEAVPDFLKKGVLTLDDACIADRESMRRAILENENSWAMLRNPQSVLEASGFVKVQSVSLVTGRKYVRMLAKGDIFEAYFETDDKYMKGLTDLFKSLRGLFVGHEVRAKFSVDEEYGRPKYECGETQADFGAKRCRLEYDLHAISRIAQINHITEEIDSHPFITGAQVRESLASRENLHGIYAGEGRNLIHSSAYINVGGHRGLPVSAGYSTKKQDANDLRDRSSIGRRPDDFDQIKGMGTLFIDDPDSENVNALSVRREQSIMQYYCKGQLRERSYDAIAAGQTFKGFIEGEAEDIGRIYESLTQDGYVRIGDCKDIGFGNAYIQVREVKPADIHPRQTAEEITVLLVSPARLYRNGLYEASAQRVLEEVEERLGGNTELKIVRNSQNTCGVAVYNKVWKELEPVEYAVSAGSVYRMRAKDDKPFDISAIAGGIFIGGHNDDGYGEVMVLPAVDAYYRRISYGEFPESALTLTYKTDPNPGRRLMRRLVKCNAKGAASYLGASRAEDFIRREFGEGKLMELKKSIGDDFDMEEVFISYIDSLKETGLNFIRRGL